MNGNKDLFELVRPSDVEHRDVIGGKRFERELRVNAEVAATGATNGPEQIGVFRRRTCKSLTVGSDDTRRREPVARKTVGTHVESDTAAEHETGNADRFASTVRDGKTRRTQRRIHVLVLRPASNARLTGGGKASIFRDGLHRVIDDYRLPAHVELMGAKGSITWRLEPLRDYRDGFDVDNRPSYLSWLWQLNRGIFKSPWAKHETWTLSVWHTEDDAARYVANFAEFATAVTA